MLPSHPRQLSGVPPPRQEGGASPIIWVFMGVILVSGGLHAYAARVQGQSNTNHDHPTDADLGGQANSPLFGVQTTLPDGRVVISCTINEIQAAFDTYTVAQINRAVVGKWIKLSGTIQNVNAASNIGVWVTLQSNVSISIFFIFENSWFEQLHALPRGRSVTIRGEARKAESTTLQVAKCELL
jgi:hypothetical protein